MVPRMDRSPPAFLFAACEKDAWADVDIGALPPGLDPSRKRNSQSYCLLLSRLLTEDDRGALIGALWALSEIKSTVVV